ncbi:MAG TPA: tetratricopeptide repeat protein, partial [Roseiflexaceae bacterium]|nr:tetratricopeptide repeat protein [Roseiflexaceae bacterium]
VLNDLGELASERGAHEQSRMLCEQSLQLAVELGDRRGQAAALKNLGRLAQRRGDAERAAALYQKNLALRIELGDKRGVASALECLSQLAPQRRITTYTRLQWQAV